MASREASKRKTVVGGVGGQDQDGSSCGPVSNRRRDRSRRLFGRSERSRFGWGVGGQSRSVGLGHMDRRVRASTVMPMNMVIEKKPMMARVSAAFFAFGFWNAGHAVADRFNPSQGGTAGGECPHRQQQHSNPHIRCSGWIGSPAVGAAGALRPAAGRRRATMA